MTPNETQLKEQNDKLVAQCRELNETIAKYKEFFKEVEESNQMTTGTWSVIQGPGQGETTIVCSTTVANQITQGTTMAFRLGKLDLESGAIVWSTCTESMAANVS